MLHYIVKYGEEIRSLRIVCIESVKPCGPRSNVDLTHYIWSTFEYYSANYAVLVIPTHVSENKIVYVRQYQAETGGETSRLCGHCLCLTKNPHAYYDFGCKKPQNLRAQFVINSPLF